MVLQRYYLKGAEGETIAADYLQRQGLRLITRNYRTRYGELDLVMCEKLDWVFVEVRYRKQGAFESVDEMKQRRVQQAAEQYLAKQGCNPNQPCRFDIVSIDQDGTLMWTKNAF